MGCLPPRRATPRVTLSSDTLRWSLVVAGAVRPARHGRQRALHVRRGVVRQAAPGSHLHRRRGRGLHHAGRLPPLRVQLDGRGDGRRAGEPLAAPRPLRRSVLLPLLRHRAHPLDATLRGLPLPVSDVGA